MADEPKPPTAPPTKADIDACRRCELGEKATQGVTGEGPADTRVMLVGEQPGHEEDMRGRPFVGPAGQLLRALLAEAGIPESRVYITNAVKHFRFELRGKRRIHQTPGPAHITACRPWLVSEFALLKPDLVVALGATAAKALFGPSFRVTRSRGELLPWPASAHRPQDFPVAESRALATIHPSAVLRADDRDAAYRGLVDDLKVAATVLT